MSSPSRSNLELDDNVGLHAAEGIMEGSSSSQHKLTLAKQTWISRCSLLFFQPNVTYEADKFRPICHSHPVLTWMFTRGQKFAKALLVFIGAGLGGLLDVANLSSSAESW